MNEQIRKIISSLEITKEASEKPKVEESRKDIPETAKALLKLSQEVSEMFKEPKKEPEQEPEKTKETVEEKPNVEKTKETQEETPHKETQKTDQENSDKDDDKVDKETDKEIDKDDEKKDEEKVKKEANVAITTEAVNPEQEPEQEPEKAPETEEHEPAVLKDGETQEEKPNIVKAEGTQNVEQKLGFVIPPGLIRGTAIGAGVLGTGFGGYQIGRMKERKRDPLIVNANAQSGFNQGYTIGSRKALDALMERMPPEMQKAITGGMQNAVIGKQACLNLEKNAGIMKWLSQNKLMLGLGAAGAAGAGIGGFALGKEKEQGNDLMLGRWGANRGFNLGYRVGASNVIDSIRSKVPETMQGQFDAIIGGENGK